MNENTHPMSDFQALVTGALAGSLMRHTLEVGIAADVGVMIDENGDYLPEFVVTGRISGERLRVRVERVSV